jgi:hypothetical protein
MNQRINGSIQNLGTVQEIKFHDENVLNSLGITLFDEFTGGSSRTTSSD